jgi:AsmA protein
VLASSMKRGIKILGILVALLLAAVIALPFVLDANQFRPLLQNKLSEALGREVTLGALQLSILSGSVTASDLSIADDPAFSKSPFVRASSLQAGVELKPLIFSRKLNVTRIVVDQPQIDLVQNPAGVWNFSSIGAKSASAPTPAAPATSDSASSLTVADIKISNGRVTLTKTVPRGAQPLILDKLNIEVKDFSADSPFTFTLAAVFSGAGDIKLDGKVGPINAGNAIATPLNANLHISHLDLGISGTVDPALGIAGIASIDGSVSSNGAAVQVAGKLQGQQLKLVKTGTPAKRTLEVDFALDHDLTKRSGDLKRGDIHLGKAVAALTGAYNMSGEVPMVNLKLAGDKLDVTELGAFLPALDVVLPAGATIEQGTAEVNFTAEGPVDKLIAAGTVALDSVRLANFDLATKLSVLEELAGIKAAPHTEIQTFRATLKSAPEGTQVEDLDLLVPSIGEITGAGTINPAHELAFKMRAALRSAAGVMAGLGSKGGIPFTVAGTSQAPSFKPDMKDLVNDKLKDLTGGLFGGKKKQ